MLWTTRLSYTNLSMKARPINDVIKIDKDSPFLRGILSIKYPIIKYAINSCNPISNILNPKLYPVLYNDPCTP